MSSYDEFKKNRKKNYSNESEYEKFKKNYRSTYSYDLGEDNIESFAKDYKALAESYSKDSSNVGYKNASDLSQKYSTSASDLRKRATQLSGYLNHNKANMSEKDYNELKSYLDSARLSLNSIEYSFKDKADYFSRFETEEDYNKEVKAIEEDEKIKTYDTKAGRKELTELQGILAEAEKLAPYDTSGTNTSNAEFGYTVTLPYDDSKLKAYLKKYGYSDINKLRADVSNKKAYLNRAEYVQKGIKLQGDALTAEDFDKYAQQGADIENPTFEDISDDTAIFGWRPFGEDINNPVAYTREYYDDYLKATLGTVVNGGSYEQNWGINSLYMEMEEEEVGIYNYYLAKEKEGLVPEGTADEFLKSLEQTLENRKAQKTFLDLENETAAEMIFAASAGIDQFVSGVKNLFNTSDEYIPVSSTQVTSALVREDLEDVGFKILGNSVGQIGYDIINTTSNMMPSILASTVVGTINPVAGTAVGAGLMGASASGNAYQEMLNLGYDKGQARTYSALVGISEAGLSYVLGGVSKLGGKLSGKAIAKLADKVDKAIGRIAINLGGKVASEFTEEYLQEVLNPVFKNIVLKTDEDVDLLSSEALYSGILGALSAGILEGGSSVSAEVNFQKQAKMYSDPETVQELINTALTLPEGSEAFNLAKEYQQKIDSGKSLKKAEILNLVEANNQGIISEDTTKMATAAEARLSELGESGDVAGLSQIIAKEVKGERLSLSENAMLRNSKYAQRVINEMNPENIASGEYSSAWAENIGTEKINTEAYNGELNQIANVSERDTSTEPSSMPTVPQNNAEGEKMISEGKLFAELPKASEGKLGVSESGQTVYAETNEPINIVEITSIEDGHVKLKTDSGEIIDASEVEFGSREEALVYESTTDMSVEVANDFIKGYNQLKAAPIANRQSLESYLVGFKEAYGYGKYGIPYSSLERDGTYATSLSPEQRKIAYNRGGIDAVNNVKSKQEALNKAKKKKGKSLKGKIEYDEGIVGTLPAGEIRSESLKMLEFFNKNFAGANIRVFASYVDENGKRVYKDTDGSVKPAPNGKYLQDGRLAIDLNAGNQGEGLILDTASHELTHRGKDFSPQKYKTYADLLFKHYGENHSVEELIQHEIDFAKSKGRTLSEEEAYHEAVARCSERMLVDCLNGTAQNFAKELYETDKSLWEKIKDFFADLVNKIKALYSQYPPESKAAQIVSEMKDVAEELQRAWLDMVVDSGQTQAAISDIVNIDVESKSVSPMMSERTWTESEYVTHREESAMAISKALGVDLETAYKYIDDINGVARLIADDRARLDYDSNLDENATVLKSNKEYKYSVDMSTLCAKRLIFTGTFDAIQKALPNTAFDSDDIVGLRAMMQNRGYEVACGICYVESTRREIGRITQEFIDRYKAAQKTGKPITRFNSKGEETVLKSEGRTFNAEKTYTPTLADLNTTDIDLVKKDHREVYDAYLSFMNARGQAKPKLLETRAEYKGEILKHFKSKSAVTSRNNAGGLRLQSFSDFEVPHLIDMMQVIMDMSRVGLKSQAYTKVPAFAEVFGNTGVKINLSLIAKGSGLDSNGNLVFDDVEGINHEEAFKLRDKFSKNVGTILVGKTDAHIIAAMADSRIDYIIPFHKSFWKESLYEALGLTGYADYTEFQNEKSIDGSKIKNYDPSEYWDYSKTGDENAQIYLQKCREEGRIPKFPQFQGYPGYWKLLIDFKMYDNDGVGSPQEVVQPTFETDAAEKILNEYKGGHRSFPIAKDVVEDFVKQYKESNKDEMYSDRDFSYNELVAKDDLQGVVIDKTQHPKITNGLVDSGWVVDTVRKKCKSVTKKGRTAYYVNVPDIGTNVEIITDGVTHGFDRPNDKSDGKSKPKAITKARVMLEIPQILSNSIEVNRSQRGNNINVPYTHVLIGTVALENDNGTLEYYAVRSMVQERKNQEPVLVEADILGRLTSVNAKKIDSPTTQVDENIVALAGGRVYQYSVADLLNDVKSVFGDTFSEDVYKHFGMKREANDFSENLLYSDRDPDSISNRNLLANALESAVKNDIEKNKLNEYKSKIDLIEAEQKKLSELRSEIKEISFSKGKRDTVKLRKLQDEATRTANRINTYDRQLLNLEATTALKNVLNREKDMAKRRQKQKDAEILKAYKDKAAATQRKLLEKAQESRMKAVEGRNKTVMRHKIQSVVSDLNQLLLNGSKDKHVTEGLQKAVATALNAINMDTVGADERVAKYNALIAKSNDPDVIASLTETRDRIQTQGDKMSDKIAALKNAYNDIINSSDPSLVNAYDSVITNYIEHVAEKVGKTSLRDMTLEQLEAIYDMYKMVLTTVRNFNKAFKMAKSESISSLGNRVMMEVEEVGGSKSHVVGGKIGTMLDAVKTFDFNNLKPVYAFERIGSNTLSRLYENVRRGEDVWAVNVTEAKEFKEKVAEKYGYKKWDLDTPYNFETSTGKKYSLTLEQMMSLYAYSKREQALPHLAEGGFVFDRNIETYKEKEKGKKSVLKYRVNTATAFKISGTEVNFIVSKLSKEQKGFVDEMQDYLSTVMGAKGNEVSMEMYGIKLFKEKFYFPLKSAKQYMYEQNEVAGEVKIKNAGFSKGTVKHANNPVILSNFMDVWANHVNDMSMYHAFVLPLEDFNRVFNYNTPADKSLDEESVKGFIQNAYGEQANQYVSQLLKDLNGGARVDPRESMAKSMIGKFKKASVFGSLSVIIQQPSAVGRALALVNAKYFDFNPKLIKHNKLWAEVKRYAPVAIIKEMGHFDTDMGMSTVEYIKGEKTLMDKADDVLSKPASYMDELTWVHIWTAVKREVAAKNKGLKGEEYLQKCGERFTEVVTKTQVYDSVLSRSANMRSKSVFMNMLTSFMAEPTTSINMLEDAIINFSRGKKGKASGQIASVAASVVLNSLLVSLVYAARDDDEDETLLEKYIGSFATELVDGLNPITYYPLLKDIWSIMQGYDVQRSDMTLVSKAVDSLKNVVSVMQTDTTDMTEEELAEHNQKVLDAWLGIAGDLSSLVGIPAKNLIRDVKAGYNVYNTANRGQESSLSLIWNEVAESVKSTVPIVGWFSKESKQDKLYDVIMSGDSAYISRLKSGYTSEKAYNTAIRKALRENDPRIREAAEARMNGDMTSYMQIALEIKAEGNFSQDNIVAAINAEITSLKSSDSSESSNSVPTFTTSDYFNAAVNGDYDDVSAVKEYLVESGKTEQQIASSLNSKVKDAYENGEIDSTKAISIMTEYGDKTLDEANISVKYIDFKADYPDYEDIVTEDKYKKYTEPMPNFNGRSLEDTGISVGVYAEYCEKSASCKGVDANGDGKADSGTKKAAVMQVINSLPLTSYQKDALYYLNGWAAGTIYEAPWH